LTDGVAGAYFVAQSERETVMKTLLQIAAVLSFGFFLAGGLLLLSIASGSQTSRDAVPVAVVGLFFMGTAFFVGPMLLAAAERLGPKDEAE
jgi:hypothetical protein